jgi:apolipoprotein N-acyltransferase
MAKNKHLSYLLLSVSAAVLLTLPWQPFKLLPSIFVGLVPLLLLEQKIRREQANTHLWVFVYTWISLLLWNIATVWWIWNASAGGAMAAFVINSLPLVLPFLLYHRRNQTNGKENVMYFVACWMCAEYLQFHWDLAFPWLLLGNVFSYLPQVAQWYELTGLLGGTLWVLLVNVQIFQLYQTWPLLNPMEKRKLVLNKVFLYLLTPLFLSFYLLANLPNASKQSADIIVVQPNLDPYSEKFGGIDPQVQLNGMLQLAEQKLDSSVQYLLLPETALQGGIQENWLADDVLIKQLQNFLLKYPFLTVISGMDSYRIYQEGEAKTLTARKFKNSEGYYDAYNAAVEISNNKPLEVYHKSKLVPGVEKMPYPQLFGFIEKYAINLGGTAGSLAADGEAKVFNSHKLGLAPIICYESVFPDFTASYVRKGADILCILTNDGWWGNTPGYKQHFDFGRLRAIENRRAIARSANTGISGFIDRDGTVLAKSAWWTEDALRMKVPVYYTETFYTKHGDWIAILFLIIAAADTLTLFLAKKPRY